MQREECRVSEQKVCLEALWAILEPLVDNCMSIVSIYGGGALTFMGLVSIPKAIVLNLFIDIVAYYIASWF
jgi:hypothetical protein